MKTNISVDRVYGDSWAEDYTHSKRTRQQYLFVQSAGHYYATPEYRIHRSGLHSHLLLYTMAGEGWLQYQGRTVPLLPGSLALIDCTLPHAYGSAEAATWELEWVHFSGSAIEGYLSEIKENWASVRLEDAQDQMEQIMAMGGRYEILEEIRCSTALIRLCSALLCALQAASGTALSPVAPVVQEAQRYLEEHYSSDIHLDALAARLQISKYYLAHTFKRQVGSSPYEYLINVRLSQAKGLLRSTDQTVETIAARCGFRSASHFIQVFKSHESLTPVQYRRGMIALEEA